MSQTGSSGAVGGAIRLPELESLRGLMALWVVAVHSLLAVGIDTAAWPGVLRWLSAGDHPVSVFILLSGFVIFNLLDNARESYGVYLTRRFLRLFPAYLVCLVMAGLTLELAMDAIRGMPWHPPFASVRLRLLEEAQQNFLPHFLSHLSLMHGAVPAGVLPDAPYTIVGQAWSISLEWQFYLLAPACLVSVRRWPRLAVPCMLALAIVLRKLAGGNPAFVFSQFEYFAVGALSYFGWKALRSTMAPGVSISAVGYAAWALLGVSLLLFPAPPALLIWALVMLSLVAGEAGQASVFERCVLLLLRWPVTRYLGKVSYSLYLVHMIVLYAVMGVLGKHLGDASPWSFLGVLFVTTACASVAAAALLYRFVEQPFMALGRRLGAPRGTRPVASS